MHRSVMLYTTPNTWVDDITVVTHVAQACNHASVDWQVVADGDVSVELRNADRQVVATGQGARRDFASGESAPTGNRVKVISMNCRHGQKPGRECDICRCASASGQWQ
ncbi:hypothetical protein ACLK1T_26675 [Escherichia coli]